MGMTNTDHTARRNRSYTVRREIAAHLGKADGYDFSCELLVTLDDDTDAILLSTSNAGFNGIEGRFENVAGTRFNRSLGAVKEF